MGTWLSEAEQREVSRKARDAVLAALGTLGGEGLRREILALALHAGGFDERELTALAPEKWREKYGSYVEYRLSFALTNLKKDGLLENPRWRVWRVAGAAADEKPPAVTEQVSAERLAELRAMPERDYLRTAEWRRTRAAALVRAGHRCALDRAHTDGLEVHHNTYERVGAELVSDLIVLCHACHTLHHQANGRPRRPASESAAKRSRAAASIAPPSAPTAAGESGNTRRATVGVDTAARRRLTLGTLVQRRK